MGLQIGDEVTVSTPDGAVHSYQVTGFLGNAPGLMRHDAYGLFLCMEDYYAIYPGVGASRKQYCQQSHQDSGRHAWYAQAEGGHCREVAGAQIPQDCAQNPDDNDP